MARSEQSGKTGRGLSEVLHYFISEEEQAEARARRGQPESGEAEAPPPPPAPAPSRWCLIVHPERPLHAALAVDLARALAGRGGSSDLVATMPRPRLVPQAERVAWRLADDTAQDVDRCLSQTSCALLVLTAEQLERLLPQLPAGLLDGVILPIDASTRGLAAALPLLRPLRGIATSLRLGALFLGAGDASGPLFARLDGAARRQLGVEIENLGSLERGADDFRLLLEGRSALEADPDSSSSRALRQIARRLTRSGVEQDEQRSLPG
jgi:hypothetical protein